MAPFGASRGKMREAEGILAPAPRLRLRLQQVPSPSRAAALSAARATRVVSACNDQGSLKFERVRQSHVSNGNISGTTDVHLDTKSSPRPVWALFECMVKDKKYAGGDGPRVGPENTSDKEHALEDSMNEPAPEPPGTNPEPRKVAPGSSRRRYHARERRDRRNKLLSSWARLVAGKCDHLASLEAQASSSRLVAAELNCAALARSLDHERCKLDDALLHQAHEAELFQTCCEMRIADMRNEESHVVREIVLQGRQSPDEPSLAAACSVVDSKVITSLPSVNVERQVQLQRRMSIGMQLFAASAVPLAARAVIGQSPGWLLKSAAASGFGLACLTSHGQRARFKGFSSTPRAIILSAVRAAQRGLAKLEEILCDDKAAHEPFAEPCPEMTDVAAQVVSTDLAIGSSSVRANYKRALAAAAYTLWLSQRFRTQVVLASGRTPASNARICALAYVLARSVDRAVVHMPFKSDQNAMKCLRFF